jgi:hypothetical protein
MTAPGHTQYLFRRFFLLWSGRPHMTVRHGRAATLSPFGAASEPRHLRRRTGLVDEDQALRIEIRLRVEPGPAPRGDVGPFLLAGVRGFF